ncbi:hypothetical protein GQ53DRAFT_177056 [Thozetella sp. PMI_491]|nr:hypothetical protein GQ53DRAFT_177056 [Thozetella sp. PMI_491]
MRCRPPPPGLHRLSRARIGRAAVSRNVIILLISPGHGTFGPGADKARGTAHWRGRLWTPCKCRGNLAIIPSSSLVDLPTEREQHPTALSSAH